SFLRALATWVAAYPAARAVRSSQGLVRWDFWGRVARVVKRTGFLPLLGKLLLCGFWLLALDRLSLDRVLGHGLWCRFWRRKFLQPHRCTRSSAQSEFTASDCAGFSSASRHSPYSLRYVFPILTRLGYSLLEKLIPKSRSRETKFNCASTLGSIP